MKYVLFYITLVTLSFSTMVNAQELILPKPINKLPKIEQKPVNKVQLEKVKDQAQFYYTRDQILLIRKSATPPPQVSDESTGETIANITNTELMLDVEIRDGLSMYNHNGWFDMSSYSDGTGLMMAFAQPVKKPIVRSTQYAPVDILFIDKQGNIKQIAPSISLSDLEADIYPESSILAYLFLRGGYAAENNINVGDEIHYHIFKKPPVILSAPPQPKPPQIESAYREPETKNRTEPPVTNIIANPKIVPKKEIKIEKNTEEPLKKTAPQSNILQNTNPLENANALQNNSDNLEMRKK